MGSINIGNSIDEGELEDELEALQQEELDQKMLGTGTVPVSDSIQRLPAVANGERKFPLTVQPQLIRHSTTTFPQPKGKPRQLRKTTRRPSSESCRPRWPCETDYTALITVSGYREPCLRLNEAAPA